MRSNRLGSSIRSAPPASPPAPTCTTRILVNNRFVDPLKIKLPRGRVLHGPTLANFEKERDRFDGMMNRPAPRVAETKGTTTRR